MTPREELGNLLRDARKAAGYSSQGAYAKSVPCSRPLISRAESARGAVPSADVLSGYIAIGADGTEVKRLIDVMGSGTPEWFMPYLIAEAAANTLRCWSPIAIPGLCQTAAYMRALFDDEGHTLDQIDALVTARTERQSVIGRVPVTLVISAHVLSRLVGSAAIMAEQCGYVASMAERRDIALHVVPEGANIGAGGGLDIAAHDREVTVCLTTGLDDVTSTAPDVVTKGVQIFERILGAAMPCRESIELARAMEDQWKQQI